MSTVLPMRSQSARNKQNRQVAHTLKLLGETIHALIHDGYTVLRYEMSEWGAPLIEIQHSAQCERLLGCWYKRIHDNEGSRYVFQKMINGCRVEWSTRGH